MKLKIQPSFERDARKSPKYIVSQLNELFTSIIAAQSLADIPGLKKLSGYKNAYPHIVNSLCSLPSVTRHPTTVNSLSSLAGFLLRPGFGWFYLAAVASHSCAGVVIAPGGKPLCVGMKPCIVCRGPCYA